MRHIIRRALVAICLAVLAALLIFDPAAAETKRRTVNVYNWSDYIDPTVIGDFTKATGIAVRYDTFDSNDVLEAKLLAGRSGYDVVAPTAYFLERQIKAGVFARLDKSKLPNLAHLWPEITRRLAQYDPDNLYGVNYMWGTTGIGYNVERVRQILPNAPVNSLRMVFDPQIVSRFRGCGVEVLDSATDVYPAALAYLGLNPDSKATPDLTRATEMLQRVRPNIRRFHGSEYINDLANGDACVVFGYSGDIIQVRLQHQRGDGGGRN